MGKSNAIHSVTDEAQENSATEATRPAILALVVVNGSAALVTFVILLSAMERDAALSRASGTAFFLSCLGVALALAAGLSKSRSVEDADRRPGGVIGWSSAPRLLFCPSLLFFVLAALALAVGTWMSTGSSAGRQVVANPVAATPSAIELVIGLFAAVGTVAVALLAIWGDKVRRWLLGPRLRLEKVKVDHPNEPELVLHKKNKSKEWCFHLRVTNRSSQAATNCRVRLRRFKRFKDGNWVDESSVVPLQFPWPFSGATNASEIAADPARAFRQIVNYELIDFGRILSGQEEEQAQDGKAPRQNARFTLLLYDPSDFRKRASLEPGESGRYHLEIISDQFISRKCQVFQVDYSDEGWTENKNDIKGRVTIRELRQTGKEKRTNGSVK